jgi:1-deoxy-D-xylulose-5-phosphate reductoisomerase
MVVARDGAVLAQLGTPDMKAPIAYGLAYPQRIDSGASRLDFTRLAALTFEPADRERFPGLYLSWEALRAAPGSTAVLNAANEVAVGAFLQGGLRFDAIRHVNAATLESVHPAADESRSIEGLLALDERARAVAREQARRLAKG